jgi:hypothetical protein
MKCHCEERSDEAISIERDCHALRVRNDNVSAFSALSIVGSRNGELSFPLYNLKFLLYFSYLREIEISKTSLVRKVMCYNIKKFSGCNVYGEHCNKEPFILTDSPQWPLKHQDKQCHRLILHIYHLHTATLNWRLT